MTSPALLKRVGFFTFPLLHITRETDPPLLMAPVLMAPVRTTMPLLRPPCLCLRLDCLWSGNKPHITGDWGRYTQKTSLAPAEANYQYGSALVVRLIEGAAFSLHLSAGPWLLVKI